MGDPAFDETKKTVERQQRQLVLGCEFLSVLSRTPALSFSVLRAYFGSVLFEPPESGRFFSLVQWRAAHPMAGSSGFVKPTEDGTRG